MVKIRLSRTGVRKSPFYRIVAVNEQVKKGGKFLDLLGYWFPRNKDVKIDKKLLDKWVNNGAQISEAVKKILK